jgi:hypothetical protein
MSCIIDLKKYLRCVQQILQNPGLIIEPDSYKQLFIIEKNKKTGEIVAWTINSKIVKLKKSNELFVNEFSRKKGERFLLEPFNYHFQPRNKGLYSYRIDKDKYGIHANPDERLDMKHRIEAKDLKLDVKSFNLYLALILALEYIHNSCKYPLDEKYADYYNEILKGGLNKL